LEVLESHCVPSIVTYDDTSHLPLANGLLLDETTVLGGSGYNPNNGPLSIRIDTNPNKGTVQVFNNFDFLYTPNQGSTGTDSFTWEVLQNGSSMIGVQEVDLALSNQQPTPGQGATTITFQNYTLDSRDNTAALFMPDNGAPIVYPSVMLNVQVQKSPPGMPYPTGQVEFTYTPSGGSETSLGVATLGQGGGASIAVDSSLIGQPGVVVKAKYKGDANFAANTASDGGKNANDLQADPQVTDNPVIPPNAINLNVVVVCGSGAERKQWWQSARAKYGTRAYIITTVHSDADLGKELSKLPAGSVIQLTIGAHGWDAGPNLGNERFNPATLDQAGAAVKQKIKNALAANNALIDLECCGAASSQTGINNMKGLDNRLNARVRGADRCISAWDDPIATWVVVNPQ
jgi:hypothetical protein